MSPKFLFLTLFGLHFGECSLRPWRLFLKGVIPGSGPDLPGLIFPTFRRNVLRKNISSNGQRQEKVRCRKVHHVVEPGMVSTAGTRLLPGEPKVGDRAGELDLLFIVGVLEPLPPAPPPTPGSRALSFWHMAWLKKPPHPPPEVQRLRPLP